MAEISDQQGNPAKAKEYRRLSRAARANFAGTEYELRRHAQLIKGVVVAVDDAEVRQQLEAQMQSAPPESQNLVAAIRQILNGQSDEDVLCERLDSLQYLIVLAILGQVKREKGKGNAQIPDFFFAVKRNLCIHKKSRGSQSLLR